MLPTLLQSFLNVSRRLTIYANTASFHHFNSPYSMNKLQTNFLKPVALNIVPSCGFKIVGRVKRRCKDCFMVRREERLFNLCKTHPRHKQMSMVKDPKNTWILTHATQSKVRPW